MRVGKIYIAALLMLFGVLKVFGQQEAMYTQYMFNGLAINPAYAGVHETISLSALFRQQWTGIDGAPSTQTFSIHSPVKKERFSLGLLAMNDKIGVTGQTGVHVAYAYRIPITDRARLSFGLKTGVTNYRSEFTQISTEDNAFMSDVNEWTPTIGFGLFYHTDRFYFGASTPQLLETTIGDNLNDSDSQVKRHYFATSGYVIDLNYSLKLKPNVLVKYVSGAPVQVDINTNLLIRDVIWVGVSWRSFDSIDALFQLQVTDKLQVGYAWDFATTTDLSRVNGGSHEFMLHYRFSFDNAKVITPRYF